MRFSELRDKYQKLSNLENKIKYYELLKQNNLNVGQKMTEDTYKKYKIAYSNLKKALMPYEHMFTINLTSYMDECIKILHEEDENWYYEYVLDKSTQEVRDDFYSTRVIDYYDYSIVFKKGKEVVPAFKLSTTQKVEYFDNTKIYMFIDQPYCIVYSPFNLNSKAMNDKFREETCKKIKELGWKLIKEKQVRLYNEKITEIESQKQELENKIKTIKDEKNEFTK